MVSAGKPVGGGRVAIDLSRNRPPWDVVKDINASDTLEGLFDGFEGVCVSGEGFGAESARCTLATRYR